MIKVVMNADGTTHLEASFTKDELEAIYAWHNGNRKRGKRKKKTNLPVFGIK